MSRSRQRPRRRERAGPRPEMQAVVDETIALFRWLEWVADELYGERARDAATRWVLRRLARHGPQTVPALARARGHRRQSVQPLVDKLAAAGLVAFADNPRHARSRLVALTHRGADLARHMDRVDARVLVAVGGDLPRSQLAAAAATLKAIRERFTVEPRWRRVAALVS